jgi:hypothetical protein
MPLKITKPSQLRTRPYTGNARPGLRVRSREEVMLQSCGVTGHVSAWWVREGSGVESCQDVVAVVVGRWCSATGPRESLGSHAMMVRSAAVTG